MAVPTNMKYKKLHFAELLISFADSYLCKWKNIPQRKQQKKKKEKDLPVNLKPQNSPWYTLTHTKEAVSETQNPSNATLSHTHNYKHIKYQRRVKQTKKKHTPGKRNNDPYINQFDQSKVIYTGNKSEFKSHWVPH